MLSSYVKPKAVRTSLLCIDKTNLSRRLICLLIALVSVLSVRLGRAQPFDTMKSFAGSDGSLPYAGLTLSGDVLYGTTYSGGTSNLGTVFQISTNGTGYSVLRSFSGGDGANPHAGLTLSGGVLYGTTSSGGTLGFGTVFRMNTDGSGFLVLRNFANFPDGAYPWAGLALSGGVLYGTTYSGGDTYNGTIFKLNTDGTNYSVIKSFAGGGDGATPFSGVTVSGGALYGTTSSGGTAGYGTVFQLNTNGMGYKALNNFTNDPDGGTPYAGVTLSAGVLYGTTTSGGDSGWGTVFKLNADGSGYKVLKSFLNSDGANPYAGVSVSGAVLSGTTSSGGSSNYGTIYQLNTDGSGFSVLRNFANTDGADPYGDLASTGTLLFGTTANGGAAGDGTVFWIDVQQPVRLSIQSAGNKIVLSWPDPSYALQSCPLATGVYTNVPGATSPYTNALSARQQFFRLIGN